MSRVVTINDDGTIEGFISAVEYAKRHNVSSSSIARYFKEGKLDGFRIGREGRGGGPVYIKADQPYPSGIPKAEIIFKTDAEREAVLKFLDSIRKENE